jgi:hypothetical protein
MKKMIAYPSTPQYREVVGNINRTNNFVGLDSNGDAIYNPSLPKPIIKFTGTVKLHGTSAAVLFNNIAGLWVQSRSNIITPQSDNAGFAFFVESKRESFINLILKVKEKYNIDLDKNTIGIYSEWAGSNIQKGVGIANIPKSCFIYGIKISPIWESEEEQKETPAYWVDYMGVRDIDNSIYNLLDFKTYEIEINFNRPELSQNKIIEMTMEVERECPVAKVFGFDNTIGEGIVFSNIDKSGTRIFFKSKGELHAGVSKVKTLKPVDDEKIQNCIDVAEKVTPAWRLEQILNETFDTLNGGTIDIKQMGTYIKAVINDVIKEEIGIISDSGLEIKDISKYLSTISRNFFLQRLNEEVGLK